MSERIEAAIYYTLNFSGERSSILQAHMLEVCPLIAEERPRLEVHFLGIGVRKAQTARLVFTSKPDNGVTATISISETVSV